MKLDRRGFVKAAGFALGAATLPSCRLFPSGGVKKPNIVYILADDLGFNELGCYGQRKIRTPHIDSLAAEGLRFTDHYSGSPVCAPSRCTLLTGLHTGHAYIRDNKEMGGWERGAREGQLHIPAGTETLGGMLQKQGYRTGAIGKWGLGGPETTGHPNAQGFDHFYGYLCQRVAHNYYPTHLWRNGEKDILDNEYFKAHQKFKGDRLKASDYDKYQGKDYAMDKMVDEALGFINENKSRPFFLYLPFPVPHVALQVPDDSLAEYRGKFDDQPYLGKKGYLPHQHPRAAYAAMITRMDRGIGQIMALLKAQGLDENTLVVFSSDNGPTFNGGVDRKYFNSAGPLRGGKCELYEGGIRVPMIARWPGRIKPGTTTSQVSAFWDIYPTLAELTGAPAPAGLDGISLLPTLLGRQGQRQHEYLYWEYRRRMQAVRLGDWKAFRPQPGKPIELYNLRSDLGEKKNLAGKYPEIISRVKEIFKTCRSPSKHFALRK